MAKYITTPIYYINGAPHVGHAYTTIMGDIMKRSFIIQGEDVFYSTGTDEFGQKNQEACHKEGIGFEEFAKRNSGWFRELWDKLGIQIDTFIRTSSDKHKKVVQECLSRVYDKGLIIKKEYTGLYCEGCEQFKKESDLDERGFCPDHQKAPVKFSEENYFIQLEPHRQWLIDKITNEPEWIQPAAFANEVLGMLREPLDDLCISRPKERVTLGVELPFDANYVTYVWFDALINYITNLDWPNDPEKFRRYWPTVIHLIAKDIIKPHCIYWPIMLRIMNIEPPHRLMIHGYWVGEGNIKMSKSIGNVVVPEEVTAEVGNDAFRFYLAHTMVGAKDAQISKNLIRQGYANLGNNLGNLHMRTYKMLEKYSQGEIPEISLDGKDRTLLRILSTTLRNSLFDIKALGDIPKLAESVLNASSELNSYIDRKEPWKLAKNEDKRKELMSCLYTLAEGLRLIACAANPLMPEISEKMLISLGLGSRKITEADFKEASLAPKGKLGASIMLFPRLEE